MTSSLISTEKFRTPVLFLVFNRPDTTQRVFEAIREAQPPRLYIAADGARTDRPGESQIVEEVRKIASDVDWPCDVKTLFREQNLGCKYAVSGAITWFFEHEEQGIILEDGAFLIHHFLVLRKAFKFLCRQSANYAYRWLQAS